MIAMLRRRPLLAALAVLAALLLAAIGFETGFGTQLRPAIAQGSSKKAAAPEAKVYPQVVAVAPEQAYPETAARPLFTPTRRPAPPEPNAGKPAFNRGQFVLQGVIVVGDERTALLREKTSGKIHRVERGKDVNGITVEKIEPTEVTLAMGGEREKLALVVLRLERPEGAARAVTSAEPAQGPFGAPAPASAAAVAPAAQAGAPPAAAQAPAIAANPAARPQPGATPVVPVQPGSQSPTGQPMSPEELLARRRARRSQPTQ